MGEHDQREDFPEAYVGQFLFKNLKEICLKIWKKEKIIFSLTNEHLV